LGQLRGWFSDQLVFVLPVVVDHHVAPLLSLQNRMRKAYAMFKMPWNSVRVILDIQERPISHHFEQLLLVCRPNVENTTHLTLSLPSAEHARKQIGRSTSAALA
jgi:hypothetical protein